MSGVVGRTEYELKLDGLNDVISGLKQVQSTAQAAARAANTSFRNINKTMQGLQTATRGAGQNFQGIANQMNTAGAAARNLNQNLNNATSGVQGASSRFANLGAQVERVGTQIREAGFNITRVGQTLTGGLTVPIVGAGAAVVGFGSQFESAFAGVIKTVDGTDQQLAILREGIRTMATELPQSAVEIAGVAEAAGQLGIQRDNILEFTRVMVDLGVATNLSSQEAAVSLARLAAITGLPASEFDRLGSTIVALGNNFATTESEIVELSLRLAGAGEVIGLTEGEVLAFATALRSIGVPAESGGTAISRVFLEINSAVKSGSEELEVFADVAQMSISEFQRAFSENPDDAIVAFIEGLDRLNRSGVDLLPVLEAVGLQNLRVRDALIRTASAGPLLRNALSLQARAWEDNNALTEEASRRYETVESQFQILKNRGIDVAIEAFDALRPVILDVIDVGNQLVDRLSGVVESFKNLSPEAQRFILSVAGIAASLGPVTIAIGAVVTAIGAFVAVAGTAGIIVAGIAGGLVALASAYALVKLNSDFANENIPNTALAINNLEESVTNLLEALGLIPDSMGEATDSMITFGEVADRVFAVFVAYPTLIVNEILLVVQAFQLIIDALQLVGAAFEDFFNGLTVSFEELFRLLSDPVALITGDVDIGSTFDFSETEQAFENLKAQGEELYQTGAKLGQDLSDGFSSTAPQIKEEMDQVFAGFTLDEFRDAFEETSNGAIDNFALMRAHVLSDLQDVDKDGIQYLISALRGAQDESELTQHLWAAMGAGIINTDDLMITSAREVVENWRFLEEQLWDTASAAEAVSEVDLDLEAKWRGALLGVGIFDQLRSQIGKSRDAISLWESDQQTVQEAIDALTGQIEKQGFATEEQAQQMDLLTWYNDRLANGITDDLTPAFIQSVANQAEWAKTQEEINEQFRGPDGTIKNQEAYNRAMEEAAKKFLEANDPLASFTGDMQKVADSFKDTITLIRDMLTELGLIPDDSFDDLAGNASNTAGNVAGLGDEIVNVGEAASKEPVVKVHTEESFTGVAGLGDELGSLPPLTTPKVEADTGESEKSIAGIGEGLTGLTSGSPYETSVSADSSDADQKVDSLLERAGTWASSNFTAKFTASIDLAAQPVDSLLNRVGSWAGQSFNATLNADEEDAVAGLDAVIQRRNTLDGSYATITVDANIAPAMAQLTILGQNTPSSPAEEGPLAKEPNIDVGADITPALQALQYLADAADFYTDEAIDKISSFVTLLNSTLDLIGSSLDLGARLNETDTFSVDTQLIRPIVEFTAYVLEEVESIVKDWEDEVVETLKQFIEVSSSAVSLIGDAADALSSLDEFDVDFARAKDAATTIKFLTEHIILSLGDSAAIIEHGEGIDHPSVRGVGFAGMAKVYAENALAGVELIGSAIENLAELDTFNVNLDSALSAATQIKFLVEHIMLSLGDSAAIIEHGEGINHPSVRGEGFVGMAGTYAEEAQKGVALIGDAFGFISSLAEFEGSFNLAGAMDFASNAKFLIEHIVLSLGDSAAAIASDANHPSYRGEGFVEIAGEFAESAGSAVGLIGDAFGFISNFADFDGEYNLDAALSAVGELKFLVEKIVLEVGDAALAIKDSQPENLLDAISGYSEAVSPAVGLLSDVFGFIVEISDYIESIAEESTLSESIIYDRLSLDPLITALADVSRYLADEILRVSAGYEEVETIASENLATAVSNAVGALTDVIDLIEALDDKTLIVPDLHGVGRQLAAQARVIAEEFLAVAEGFSDEVDPAAETMATEVSNAIGAISDVFDFLQNFRPEYDGDGKAVPIITQLEGLRGIARQLAEQARVIAEEFADAASDWNTDLNESIEKFAEAVGNALGALNEIFDFIDRVNELATGKGGEGRGGSGTDTQSAFGRAGVLNSQGGGGSNPLVKNLESIGEAIGLVVEAFIKAIEEHEAEMTRVRDGLTVFTESFSIITTQFIGATLASYQSFSIDYITIHTEMNASVLSIWESGAEQMIAVGVAFIDGMIRGLEQREGALYAKVKEIVDKAIAAAKAAAQSASPSKRTMEIGQDLGDGLVVGISESKVDVAEATVSLVEEVIGAMAALDQYLTDDAMAGIGVAGERLEGFAAPVETLSGIVGNLTGTFTDLAEAIALMSDPTFAANVGDAFMGMVESALDAIARIDQLLSQDGVIEGLEIASGHIEVLATALEHLASAINSIVEINTTLNEAGGIVTGTPSGSVGGGLFENLFGTQDNDQGWNDRSRNKTGLDYFAELGASLSSEQNQTSPELRGVFANQQQDAPQYKFVPDDVLYEEVIDIRNLYNGETGEHNRSSALVLTPANIAGIDPSEWLVRRLQGYNPKARVHVEKGLLNFGWGGEEVEQVHDVLKHSLPRSKYSGFRGGGFTLGEGFGYLHPNEAIINPSARILEPLGEAISDSIMKSMEGENPLYRLSVLAAESRANEMRTLATMNDVMKKGIEHNTTGEVHSHVTVNAPDTRPSTIENAITIANQRNAKKMARKL